MKITSAPPATAKKTKKKNLSAEANALAATHSSEAIMTLVAIMQNEEDPKARIAAAKALLDKSEGADFEALAGTPAPLSDDELQSALTLAKAILDELAARKACGMDGAGAMVIESAGQPDNTHDNSGL